MVGIIHPVGPYITLKERTEWRGMVKAAQLEALCITSGSVRLRVLPPQPSSACRTHFPCRLNAYPAQAERISDIRRKSIFLSMEVFVATFSSGCASNRYV
ncbi:hypothetical protein NSB26_13210 [Phocaeicola sartorii]|uniref:hypothetical protein n=1 Tax=Phocaeicola sartorii TaxID=671267 RepID=UPI002613CEBC|nr:hypothetical protein [Phocaeicola sartorii]MCR1846039.1 hypothetical protein [Phocaeicola sartorii]